MPLRDLCDPTGQTWCHHMQSVLPQVGNETILKRVSQTILFFNLILENSVYIGLYLQTYFYLPHAFTCNLG